MFNENIKTIIDDKYIMPMLQTRSLRANNKVYICIAVLVLFTQNI